MVGVEGDRARLACESVTATCAACSSGRGCALKRLAGQGAAALSVPRCTEGGVPLEPGACVTVEVSDGEILAAAARAYLPPLAGLLALPLLMRAWGRAGDLPELLGALAGLLLGWAGARTWLKRVPPRVAVRVEDGRAA